MWTSEERIAELHRRIDVLKKADVRRRYRQTCVVAFAACLSVTILLALGVSRLPIQANDVAFVSSTASIFANHPLVGYVVVALVALCLGILVTIFCFRLKQRIEEEEKRDDRKH